MKKYFTQKQQAILRPCGILPCFGIHLSSLHDNQLPCHCVVVAPLFSAKANALVCFYFDISNHPTLQLCGETAGKPNPKYI